MYTTTLALCEQTLMRKEYPIQIYTIISDDS